MFYLSTLWVLYGYSMGTLWSREAATGCSAELIGIILQIALPGFGGVGLNWGVLIVGSEDP